MKKGYMARRIIIAHSSGEVEEHVLSVVFLDTESGDISVFPFERELPGVEYLDGPLHLYQSTDGKWKVSD